MTPPSNRKLVLVADDLDDIRLLVSTCLSDAGYEVIHASDGGEALHVILDRQPDLAVLDVMMPHLDGFEVMNALRARAPSQPTKVLIVTAFAAHFEFNTGGPGENADEYLLKPFAPDELLTRVGRLIGRPEPELLAHPPVG